VVVEIQRRRKVAVVIDEKACLGTKYCQAVKKSSL